MAEEATVACHWLMAAGLGVGSLYQRGPYWHSWCLGRRWTGSRSRMPLRLLPLLWDKGHGMSLGLGRTLKMGLVAILLAQPFRLLVNISLLSPLFLLCSLLLFPLLFEKFHCLSFLSQFLLASCLSICLLFALQLSCLSFGLCLETCCLCIHLPLCPWI